MKFSLNWLKEFVDIDISVDELTQKLTFAGFEVEGITHFGHELSHIVTGKIQKIEKHPNADKLLITQIWDGQTTHQIVTGASNVFEGAIVPASLVGATLCGGFQIKKSILRGIESNGMLCSEKELGLAEESSGIWILPQDTPIGVDIVNYLQLRDTVIDVSILPNRGDAQSILGLAREIAVILDKPLRFPSIQIHEIFDSSTVIPIEVQAPELCPKYTARIIRDIVIKPSPFWMQQRLKVSGIRPINNIVDITNYVLLELGQPLHAFDLAYLDGPSIVVRTATNRETIQTLDGVTRSLNTDTLLICDANKPVALAGIMGGSNSEIKPNTQNILIESAFFKPTCIRKTETQLGLRSESSIRFEKGVDFDLVETASNRTAALIQDLANGKVIAGLQSKIYSESSFNCKKKIPFQADGINRILGTNFATDMMVALLQKLGFQFNNDQTEIIVPSYRQNDISELPCLAEEIARMIGLDAIPLKYPDKFVLMKSESRLEQLIKTAQTTIKGLGFFEIRTFSMISEKDIQAAFQPDQFLKLKNPLSPEESVMRPHLLASGLKVVGYNLNRQMSNLKLFEIGKVFIPETADTHREELMFQTLATGKIMPQGFMPSEKQDNDIDFRYLKGIVERFFETLSYADIAFESTTQSYLHPIQSSQIKINGISVGELGFVHPTVCDQYDISVPVGFISINLTQLEKLQTTKKKFKVFSRFPAIRRDFAMLVPKTLTYSQIETAILENKPKLLKEFYLFDYFVSEKIGADKQSIAMAFIYQSDTETLTDDKINGVHDAFSKRLQQKLPIEMRS